MSRNDMEVTGDGARMQVLTPTITVIDTSGQKKVITAVDDYVVSDLKHHAKLAFNIQNGEVTLRLENQPQLKLRDDERVSELFQQFGLSFTVRMEVNTALAQPAPTQEMSSQDQGENAQPASQPRTTTDHPNINTFLNICVSIKKILLSLSITEEATQLQSQLSQRFVWPLSLHAWNAVDDCWAPPPQQAKVSQSSAQKDSKANRQDSVEGATLAARDSGMKRIATMTAIFLALVGGVFWYDMTLGFTIVLLVLTIPSLVVAGIWKRQMHKPADEGGPVTSMLGGDGLFGEKFTVSAAA